MIKLVINFLLTLSLYSCQLQNTQQISKKTDEVNDNLSKTDSIIVNNEKIIQKKKPNNARLYIVGEPYFINGVKYIPEENYSYSKKGLATYYNKELHNKKTINNEYNKVTELLGRHKTLPIPSIVKITNLENGLSLIIRINDRHDDNASIIQVSRKVAQLLKFYKNKIAKVKIEIQSDPSKQMKIVTMSMSEPNFDTTLQAVPTEKVIETDLGNYEDENEKTKTFINEPIELNYEQIYEQSLYIKIYGFKSYDEAKKIIDELSLNFMTTTEKDKELYNVLLGPIENKDANKLVSSFISKGYKKTEILFID